MLQELVAGLYAERPTVMLYHYTSLEGLLGIVESCSLRAGDLRYMNDAQELTYFTDLLATAAALITEPAADIEILRQLIGWLTSRRHGSRIVCAASMTEQGNLLSQWRGYCPHGRGVSIGFQAGDLSKTAEAGGFSVGRCIYDPQNQQRIADAVVNAVIAECKARGPASDRDWHPSQSFWGVFGEIEAWIFLVAALIKHPSFQEEVEWRFVSQPISNYGETPFQFRAGSSFLIPFLPMPLPAIEGRIALDQVIIGPTAEPNLSLQSVSYFLARSCPSSRQRAVIACRIPYRQ